MGREQQPIHYFPPTERKAMMNAGIILSRRQIDLAAEVERSLAREGVIVPGSLQDIPHPEKVTFIGRVLSLLNN